MITEININEFILVLAFDNEVDFFRKVKGCDSIGMLDYSPEKLEKELDRHKSNLSIMESYILQNNNRIENNKEKILEAVKKLSKDKKWIIVRYELPETEYIYDTSPRVVGWSTKSKS